MKSTTKKLSETKLEIKVTMDANDLKAARALALEALSEEVKLPGFRKGKAPAKMIESHVDANEIAARTLDIAVRDTLNDALHAEKILPLTVENVQVKKYVPSESGEFSAEVEILPEMKLGDFRKLKAKMPSVEPTAAEVQEVVDRITEAYAEHTKVDRAAKLGDEVVIDFVGKKDGKAFEGGSAKGHHLMLGSGQFIPGFEDGIVGKKPGDKFELELTFPKDYGEKSLAGAKTTFEVILHNVNELKKPAEDDELAKKCQFKTMKELRDDITKNLKMQNSHQAKEKYRDELVGELVKKSKIAAPEILINDQMRLIREDAMRNAATYGLSFEQYLQQLGQSAGEWDKQMRDLAKARVEASLALQLLARDQNIEAGEEEVDAKLAELKDVYKNSKEALANLKKPQVRQDLKNRLTVEKTLEFLEKANAGAKAAK